MGLGHICLQQTARALILLALLTNAPLTLASVRTPINAEENGVSSQEIPIASAMQRAQNDLQIRRLRKLLTTRGVNTDQVYKQLETIIRQEAQVR